jgi:hypothetical protein
MGGDPILQGRVLPFDEEHIIRAARCVPEARARLVKLTGHNVPDGGVEVPRRAAAARTARRARYDRHDRDRRALL